MRLIHDTPLPGPTNMARDEALMTCVGQRESPPTLRLYRWADPTISLGYFQRYAEYATLPPPAGSLPIVRRLTGGGAILHDLELTYSIALPIDHPLLDQGPNKLYEIAHDAVIDALGEQGVGTHRCGITDDSGAAKGPFFCFERRHCLDVLLDERKIAGSAQRRTRSAVLQHGSIILANRYSQQSTAVVDQPFEEALARVAPRFVQAFADRIQQTASPGPWSDNELALAESLELKYAGAEWTKRV